MVELPELAVEVTRRLVVAPHADDESMGCGGLLATYPDECMVVVAAQPSIQRQLEMAHALNVFRMAPEQLRTGNFPDGNLGDDMSALVGWLDGLMRRYRPDEVYLPYPSLHQDHVAVYEAGMRACRLSMRPDHWYPRKVLVYDVQVYDIDLYETGLKWNVYLPLTDEAVGLKQQACDQYRGETPYPDHPIKSMREFAAAAGRPRGVPYAERYALVREIL